MKEIKAYIKPQISNKVISALKLAGATGIKIRKVSIIGYPLEYLTKFFGGINLEFICEDEESKDFIEIIVKAAQEQKCN